MNLFPQGAVHNSGTICASTSSFSAVTGPCANYPQSSPARPQPIRANPGELPLLLTYPYSLLTCPTLPITPTTLLYKESTSNKHDSVYMQTSEEHR